MAFWSKKREENVDQEELSKLKQRVFKLESQILDCMMAQEILRNKVLRKIQFKRPEDEEEEEDKQPGMLAGLPKTKNINSKLSPF